jgi:hypothetical protein
MENKSESYRRWDIKWIGIQTTISSIPMHVQVKKIKKDPPTQN